MVSLLDVQLDVEGLAKAAHEDYRLKHPEMRIVPWADTSEGARQVGRERIESVLALLRRVSGKGAQAKWLDEPFSTGESWRDTIARAARAQEGSYIRRRLMECITVEKIAELVVAPVPATPSLLTRFDDFDDAEHPCNKWWNEHGQYMMAGGGRTQFIWACRGWIAHEQFASGVEVTGESICEDKPTTQGTPEGAK